MSAPFDIPRHNDPTYVPLESWTTWDGYAGCWTCRMCGAAAGYQLHNPSCRFRFIDAETAAFLRKTSL
jgi:hypothetical protein